MGFDALIINGPTAFSLSIIRNLSAHFVLHMKNNGMFKYFLKDFEGLGKIHVPVTMTFRKMSQLILKKMLKRLQNLQSLIFFIFGVEKL